MHSWVLVSIFLISYLNILSQAGWSAKAHNLVYSYLHRARFLMASSYGMSCPSWQWHRAGYSWSPIRTLPVAPLWCDLGLWSRTVVAIKLRRTSAFCCLHQVSMLKSQCHRHYIPFFLNGVQCTQLKQTHNVMLAFQTSLKLWTPILKLVQISSW